MLITSFSPFSVFSTLSMRETVILTMFDLSSADPFNLTMSKILSNSKGLEWKTGNHLLHYPKYKQLKGLGTLESVMHKKKMLYATIFPFLYFVFKDKFQHLSSICFRNISFHFRQISIQQLSKGSRLFAHDDSIPLKFYSVLFSLCSKKGFNVRSFGTGNQVKLPGPAANMPNIYDFDTTYDEMYSDLKRKDPDLYPFHQKSLYFTSCALLWGGFTLS